VMAKFAIGFFFGAVTMLVVIVILMEGGER
jgi:hypothetical protein